MEKEFKVCSSSRHESYGSAYNRKFVPFKYFFNDPANPKGREFSTCMHCRNYKAEAERRRRKKLVENSQNIQTDPEYKYCPSAVHSKNVSNYPRDKVPILMFKKGEKTFKHCSDCRIFSGEYKREKMADMREFLKDNPDVFFCFSCQFYFDSKDEMHIKEDGSIGTRCLSCKEFNIYRLKEKYQRKRAWYNNIKMKLFLNYENTCRRCDKIFIIPKENSLIVREVIPYFKDGIKMVEYEKINYSVKEFMLKFPQLLEMRIIQLDHLSEREQRQRGILKENEIYEGKKHNVGDCKQFSSEKEMEKEAEKCQHLCCKCHIIVSKERELGVENRSLNVKAKRAYVNKIKESGCSSCGFKDVNLLRFFDMDHIDVDTKIEVVSHMVMFSNYTLEDVIEECKKCRVLCKHCHWIHSSNQRNQY